MGCALSPNFDYEFHYSARLGHGLPNTRSQVAGTAIEFDVFVSMKTASEAFVKVNKLYKLKKNSIILSWQLVWIF